MDARDAWMQLGASSGDASGGLFMSSSPWRPARVALEDTSLQIIEAGAPGGRPEARVTMRPPSCASLRVVAPAARLGGRYVAWVRAIPSGGGALLGFDSAEERAAWLAALGPHAAPGVEVSVAAAAPAAEGGAGEADMRLVPPSIDDGEWGAALCLRGLEALVGTGDAAAAPGGAAVRLTRGDAEVQAPAALLVLSGPEGRPEVSASFLVPPLPEAGVWALRLSVDGGGTWAYTALELMVYRTDVVRAVNLGGPAYVDTGGVRYEQGMDKTNYDHTDFGAIRTSGAVPHQAIRNTDDGLLYGTALSTHWHTLSGTSFRGEAAPGHYFVTMKFAQLVHPMVGAEYMRLLVQGRVIVDRLDIVAKAGFMAAHDVVAPLDVGGDGRWEIRMEGQGGSMIPAPGAEASRCFMNAYVVALRPAASRARGLRAGTRRAEELARASVPVARTLTMDRRRILDATLSANLLTNPSGERDTEGWEVLQSGGDGFATGAGGHKAACHLKTSFGWDVRAQTVDLVAAGLPAAFLDTAPEITVEDWYNGSGYFRFRARLLAADGREVAEYEFEPPGGVEVSTWTRCGTTFRGYGQGVRKVYFEDGGKDKPFWKGHYGPTISGSSVQVVRPAGAGGAGFASESVEGIVAELLSEPNEAPSELGQAGAPLLVGPAEDALAVERRPAAPAQLADLHKRECRIFLSSTFRDFFEERELLVKRVLPQLAKLCDARGTVLTFVDLRTGVTSEQSGGGHVLELCLAEIDRCRPYFIAMLGNRYGWSHQQDHTDTLLQQTFDNAIAALGEGGAWLDKYRDRSVTEIEIRHGLLIQPPRAGTAFTYVRDPAYADSLPPEKRQEFEPENSSSAARLAALKRDLRDAGLPIQSYAAPPDLAAMVLADLSEMVRREFPPLSADDWLERSRLEHIAFLESRSEVYIGGEALFAALDGHARDPGALPLVVSGASGGGKSALLANWVARVGRDNARRPPDEAFAMIFFHFIGATSDSSDHIAMLRRVMGEIRKTFEIGDEIPNDPQTVVSEFPSWLRIAAARGRVLLVLDALNQLLDNDNAPSLAWLQTEFPPQVRVVLSVADDSKVAEVLAERPAARLAVKPLGVDEKRQVVAAYMQRFGKALSPAHLDAVAQAPQCSTHLFLIVLLNEVRLLGSFDRFEDELRHLLTAEDIPGLFGLLLARIERDFGFEPVSRIMSAIWVSRAGLSEAELMAVAGIAARADFSPLFLTLAAHLVCRAGLYTFYHDFLRQAVTERYMGDPRHVATTRKRIVEHFVEAEEGKAGGGEGEEAGPGRLPAAPLRYATELPHQLFRLEDWSALQSTLLELPTFVALFESSTGRFDLLRYWRALDAAMPPGKGPAAYIERLTAAEEGGGVRGGQVPALAQRLSRLYQDLGEYGLAESALKCFPVARSAKVSDRPASPDAAIARREAGAGAAAQASAVATLLDLGAVCRAQGDPKRAADVYRQALALQVTAIGLAPEERLSGAAALVGLAGALAEDPDGLSQSGVRITTDSVYLTSVADPDAVARLCLRAALDALQELLGPSHLAVEATTSALALVYHRAGLLAHARAAFREQLATLRASVGVHHPFTAIALSNLGLLELDEGRLARADALLRCSRAILREVYGEGHPMYGAACYNHALAKAGLGRGGEAGELAGRAAAALECSLGEAHADARLARHAAAELAIAS
eukprot:tig00021246_g19610.t1